MLERVDRAERVDRRDVRDVRLDSTENRCCSAACSQDALDIMRGSNSMQPRRQGDASDISQLSRSGYPPPLTLDNSASNPDNEAWRRYNPFDKHYVGRGAGAIGAYDRSPDPQYRLDSDPRVASSGNEYRFVPYQRPYQAPSERGNGYDQPLNNPYRRGPYDSGYGEAPYRTNPSESQYRRPSDQTLPDRFQQRPERSGNAFRDPSDRNSFYAHQNDAYSCSAFSMAMMCSDWNTGRPPSNAESSRWKQIAGTIGRGYRGSLDQVASNLREGIPDLHTKVYNYGMGRVGQQAMQDLNRELAQGHTAVAKVINPHTGNPHYIYIAGRTQNGDYILGDPDRKNPHQQPVSGQRLLSMMSRRDGFVAGWKDSMSVASRSQGTAANRYAMSRYSGEQDYRA